MISPQFTCWKTYTPIWLTLSDYIMSCSFAKSKLYCKYGYKLYYSQNVWEKLISEIEHKSGNRNICISEDKYSKKINPNSDSTPCSPSTLNATSIRPSEVQNDKAIKDNAIQPITEFNQLSPMGKINSDHERTPAQTFFEENKEQLLQRMKIYYQKKLDQFDNDYFWDYYHDPVVRQTKNHLWNINPHDEGLPREEVHLRKGELPSIEEIINILEQQCTKDILVVNLEDCGRRDIGLYAIISSGQNESHCKRVGHILSKLFQSLEIPFLSTNTNKSNLVTYDWIIIKHGPLQIHLMTESQRKKYSLEKIWLSPHEYFEQDDFPGYFDQSIGIPPPFITKSKVISSSELSYKKFDESNSI